MAKVNIALETFGIFITLLILCCCILEQNEQDKLTRLLVAMLTANGAVLLCDVLTWVFEYQTEYTVMLYGLNFLVYSLGYIITAIFTYYLVCYIHRRKKISFTIAHVITVLCGIAVLLVVVSLFNKMYFSFEDGIYTRGRLYWLSQLYPIGIMVVDMAIVVHHRRIIGLHDTLALLSYGVMPLVAMVIQIFFYGVTLLYLATTSSMLIIYVTIHVEQSRKLKEQEVELGKMRVSIMLSQIQPHFLYNALSSIAYLCDKDPPRAKQATLDFTEYLRGNMNAITLQNPVPFDKELEHLRVYLALEKMRFGDMLNIVYDIEESGFMLPALTVQPIAENAVKYGVGRAEDGGTVTIASREKPDCFEVTISDDGVGFDPMEVQYDGRSHIGIDNVRSRLAVMVHGTLTIQSIKDVGTTAVIRIPKEE